jgi:hypothetical protein
MCPAGGTLLSSSFARTRWRGSCRGRSRVSRRADRVVSRLGTKLLAPFLPAQSSPGAGRAASGLGSGPRSPVGWPRYSSCSPPSHDNSSQPGKSFPAPGKFERRRDDTAGAGQGARGRKAVTRSGTTPHTPHPQTSPTNEERHSRVGSRRGSGFDDADVSSIPPIIPYGGFSPIRLQG